MLSCTWVKFNQLLLTLGYYFLSLNVGSIFNFAYLALSVYFPKDHIPDADAYNICTYLYMHEIVGLL